jgi:hypothetical protein
LAAAPSFKNKTMAQKVKFLKSPTGAYKLAYNVGDIAQVEKAQADLLIKEGFAEAVKTPKAKAKK